MTWTAGALIKELAALDPDTDVYVTVENADLERIGRLHRSFFRRRSRATLRHILRTRVVRVTATDRFAYIEGEAT